MVRAVGNRMIGAGALAMLLVGLLVLPVSASGEDPIVTDPCGNLGGTGGGEPVTLPHLDVCQADVDVAYDDTSLVLTLSATFAGDLGDLSGAAYRFGWTNESGCAQFVEVRDPRPGPVGLFAHGCDAGQQASLGGLSPDSCADARPFLTVRTCYGENYEWVPLPADAVVIDGPTMTIDLPVHRRLDDAIDAGFAGGATLADVTVSTFLRAARFRTQVRSMDSGLNGETYSISPADNAAGGDVALPTPPDGWDPQTPPGAGPRHVFGDGFTITTSQTGRFELVVPDDAQLSLSGMTVAGDAEWAGFTMEQAGRPEAFAAHWWRGPSDVPLSSIRSHIDDAQPAPAPGGLLGYQGVRSCDDACRVPAGVYTVVVLAVNGETTVTLRTDDAVSSPAAVGGIRPLIVTDRTLPLDVDFDEMGTSGVASAASFMGPVAEGTLAFSEMRSAVETEVVGQVSLKSCIRVGNECAHEQEHLYVANAAQGREGIMSPAFTVLPAGELMLGVTANWNDVGAGSAAADLDVLYVTPG